jgi:hypothetical protein
LKGSKSLSRRSKSHSKIRGIKMDAGFVNAKGNTDLQLR